MRKSITFTVKKPATKKAKKTAASRAQRLRKRPRIPSILVDIATALEVQIEGGESLKFPLSGNWALCSNRAGNELWIVSRKGGKPVSTEDERGERLYESFTGFEHDEVGKLIHAHPKSLTRFGRAMSIVYRSDKFSTSKSDYIHAFIKYPAVSVDNPKTPTIVALRGANIRIKKEGITG